MAFECNLAAGNKAARQHRVIRQCVEHQQVLPEIISALWTVHGNPRYNALGTFDKSEGAFKLQMPEWLSCAIPGSLTRKALLWDLNDVFRAKKGMEIVVFLLHSRCQLIINMCKDITRTTCASVATTGCVKVWVKTLKWLVLDEKSRV